MNSRKDREYETDEILGRYLDADEEEAEQRRLLNDDIIGKYMREKPSSGTAGEEAKRRAEHAAAERRAAAAEKAAAQRRRKRRRTAAGILTAVVLIAVLGLWQHHRAPLSPSDLSDAEAEQALKELEENTAASSVSSPESADAAEAGSAADTAAAESVLSEAAPEATPEPTPAPDTSHYDPADDWCLILVNAEHPLPEGYDPEVVLIENDQSADVRCSDALLKMLTDCRLEGLNPLVISGFREHELQELYFQNMTDMYLGAGEDLETAQKHAGESVAVPGTSEHELGLAVDIGTTTNPDVDESQLNEPAQQWLMEHCWEYGFVVRYPEDKSEITGIIFEPWHYRYVGLTASHVMRSENLCLEEYLEKYVNASPDTEEQTDSGSETAESSQPDSSSSVLP